MDRIKEGDNATSDADKGITSFTPTVIEKVKENSQEILLEDILRYFVSDLESGKITLNQSLIASREKLLAVLDVFFKRYLIENINYEHFSLLVFNFEGMSSNIGEIPLGTKISEFKASRREKYDKFILNYAEYNSQLLKVDCTFSRIYIEADNGKEVIFDYKFDEFVAYMFSKGMRYGLDVKEINKGIFAQYHKAAIANIKPPTVGKPSSLEVVVSLKPDKKPIEVGVKENVNFKKYRCTFPEINCEVNGGLIAIKTKPTVGNKGMQIDGKVIEGFLGEDKINMQTLCGSGTSYSEDDTKVYINASESGFINADMEYEGPGVQRPTKITVSKEIVYRGDIGKETQSLEIICGEKISLTGSIKKYYELIGNNIRVENGNIEGKLTSVHGNVNIFGNVINGNVTALDGNTFINGNVITSSYIESLKGDIEIDYAEFSTIIGKNVKINKKAIGCTIICDNLIAEEINACNLLIKKSIKVNKFEAKYHKGELEDLKTKDTRIILLFKKDILGNIEMLKKIKRKMAIYLHKDNSSPEAVEKMEELNNLLAQVSSEQEKRELEINKEEYSIDINYGNNEQYLNMKLADFFESFQIEDLNNLEGDKKENKKEILLEKLKHLFSEWDNDHIGKLMLGDFEYAQYTDYTSILKLDFDKIKKVIEHEINEACLIRNPKEQRINSIERREEHRLEFGYIKKDENGDPIDIILNEKVPIKIDSKDGFLKDISVGGIGFFIHKDKIDPNEEIFYQENDIVDLNMHLEGLGGRERIFNIKLILTFRKEIGDKVMFGAKFIGLRGKIDTEMRQCIRKFEIENLRKTREMQFASILDKKAD